MKNKFSTKQFPSEDNTYEQSRRMERGMNQEGCPGHRVLRKLHLKV